MNNDEFKSISQKIDNTRADLRRLQIQIQQQYTDELAIQEKEALLQLERWSMIEESILKKKARVSRIKLGDSNNKYFSAVIKEKKAAQTHCGTHSIKWR